MYLLCIRGRVADADEDTGEAEAGDDGFVDLGKGHIAPQRPTARPCCIDNLHCMAVLYYHAMQDYVGVTLLLIVEPSISRLALSS